MRSTLSSFGRRGTELSWTPGRELSDAERRQVPPGFDAVAEALVSGRSPVAACAVVGQAAARDGAALAETLAGLARTFTALGGAVPEFAATEALSVAWSEATLEFLHELSCEDPLTGLASFSHLRTRAAELYREAEASGVPVSGTHALVVVDVVGAPGEGAGAPFTRALRLARSPRRCGCSSGVRRRSPGPGATGSWCWCAGGPSWVRRSGSPGTSSPTSSCPTFRGPGSRGCRRRPSSVYGSSRSWRAHPQSDNTLDKKTPLAKRLHNLRSGRSSRRSVRRLGAVEWTGWRTTGTTAG